MSTTKRDEFIKLLDYAHDEQKKVFAGLSPDVRNSSGTWEDWAPKDFLAHIMYWQGTDLERLDALDVPPASDGSDFQERNHKNYLRHEQRSYSDIAADAEQIYAGLLERLHRLDDEQLNASDQYPAYPKASIYGRVSGDSYAHVFEHIAKLYMKQGQKDKAIKVQQSAAERQVAYDPSPRSRGTTLYNLACFFALNDQPEEAVNYLEQAFPLRPDLAEFSKQDSDLDSLRDLPAYQALTAAAVA